MFDLLADINVVLDVFERSVLRQALQDAHDFARPLTDVSTSTGFAFKVTDNGGGGTADRITLPQTGQTCATFNTLGNFALTSGDIEVDDQP